MSVTQAPNNAQRTKHNRQTGKTAIFHQFKNYVNETLPIFETPLFSLQEWQKWIKIGQFEYEAARVPIESGIYFSPLLPRVYAKLNWRCWLRAAHTKHHANKRNENAKVNDLCILAACWHLCADHAHETRTILGRITSASRARECASHFPTYIYRQGSFSHAHRRTHIREAPLRSHIDDSSDTLIHALAFCFLFFFF